MVLMLRALEVFEGVLQSGLGLVSVLLQASHILALAQVCHVATLEHRPAADLLELLRQIGALPQVVQERRARPRTDDLPYHVVLLLPNVEFDRLRNGLGCAS